MTTVKTSPRGRNLMYSRAQSVRLWAYELEQKLNAEEIDVDDALQIVNVMISVTKKLDQHLKAQRRAATKTLKVVQDD